MANEITTAQAIKSLDSTAEFTIYEDVITWITTPIDEALITAELTRLQAEYDAQEYARSRETEYPTIQECVHAILDDDLDALQVLRQAVKDKYPKP